VQGSFVCDFCAWWQEETSNNVGWTVWLTMNSSVAVFSICILWLWTVMVWTKLATVCLDQLCMRVSLQNQVGHFTENIF